MTTICGMATIVLSSSAGGKPYKLLRFESGSVSILKNFMTGAPIYRISKDGGSRDYSHSKDLHSLPSSARR